MTYHEKMLKIRKTKRVIKQLTRKIEVLVSQNKEHLNHGRFAKYRYSCLIIKDLNIERLRLEKELVRLETSND